MAPARLAQSGSAAGPVLITVAAVWSCWPLAGACTWAAARGYLAWRK